MPCCLLLQVDILASELTTGTPDMGTRAGLAPWAVGALIGGAAEATVASVLNGEAAALGCNTVSWAVRPTPGCCTLPKCFKSATAAQ